VLVGREQVGRGRGTRERSGPSHACHFLDSPGGEGSRLFLLFTSSQMRSWAGGCCLCASPSSFSRDSHTAPGSELPVRHGPTTYSPASSCSQFSCYVQPQLGRIGLGAAPSLEARPRPSEGACRGAACCPLATADLRLARRRRAANLDRLTTSSEECAVLDPAQHASSGTRLVLRDFRSELGELGR
jgi:hypothetical protein